MDNIASSHLSYMGMDMDMERNSLLLVSNAIDFRISYITVLVTGYWLLLVQLQIDSR